MSAAPADPDCCTQQSDQISAHPQKPENIVAKDITILNQANAKFNLIIFPQIVHDTLTNIDFKNLDKIEDISSLSYSLFPCLKDLNLSGNKLKSVPVLSFPKLQFFRLNKNQINTIELLSQSMLPELSILQLQCNQLQVLPYLPFPKLKKIFAHKNKFKDVSEFKNSPIQKFSILNICDHPDLKQLPNLKCQFAELYINGSGLKVIQEVNQMKNLIKLQFNKNNLTYLPKLDHPNLVMLQVQDNLLTQIDDFAKGEYNEITQFSIKGNKITKLPKIHMSKLLRGHFNQNIIEDVTQFCQSKFESIVMLSLEQNNLSKIPKLPFSTMEQLYISKNPIQKVYFMTLDEYPKLNMFVAATTNINEVQNMPKMPLLQKMWFNDSKMESIEWLAESGQNLPKLILFAAPKNKISNLPNLSKIKSAVKILINENPIQNVDDYLQTPKQIRDMHLSIAIQLKCSCYDEFKAKEQNIKQITGNKVVIGQYVQ